MIVGIGEMDWTAEADDMSLKEISLLVGHEPTCYTSVRGLGFGNMAASFAQPFMSKIKLGATVTAINYENTRKAIITYTDSGATKQVAARAALVTVPLGVLKAKKITFNPSLPGWKQNVIDSVGFGVLNKCIMQWTNNDSAQVWPSRPWFHLITPDGDTKWTTFWNPSDIKGIPTLVGLVGGDEAREMENQTDAEVLDDAMKNLRAMFPSIGPPDRVIVTRWGREETTMGTYSYARVGRNHDSDSYALAERVGNVLFAGEATARSWRGSVPGAWQTGEEAARKILDDSRTWEGLTQDPRSAPEAMAVSSPEDYYDEWWDDLPRRIQIAFEALGYTQTMWNGGNDPGSYYMYWDELTFEMQEAAGVIGWTQQSWDGSR